MNLSNLINQVLDGKYLIEKQLGKGGMGAVFLSTHLGTKRHVAVKVIMPQYMKEHEFIERFRREAEAAGRLRHPNVVDVTDFGFASLDGQQIAYLVMEYLDGCALDEILAGGERLPPDFALDIIEQTCSAVHEAHREDIIHRDLKPANIWLEPNRRGGFTVKVLDFGIAKLGNVAEPSTQTYIAAATPDSSHQAESKTMLLIDEEETLISSGRLEDTIAVKGSEETLRDAPAQTTSPNESLDPQTAPTEIDPLVTVQTEKIAHQSSTNEQATAQLTNLTRHGSLLGTPLYMSPEQWGGQTLDARSDVYSLGVIAYQMLSGKTPFAGDFHQVMQAHLMAQPPRLHAKGLSRKAARVVMSALEKDPSRRPVSASAFANKLHANSESVFTVLRNSLTVFSQYITKFLIVGFFVLLPFNLIVIAQAFLYFLYYLGILPRLVAEIIYTVLDVARLFVRPYSLLILTGLITWIIASINAAPLRPVKIRSALSALKDRIAPLTLTGLMINVLFFIGLVMLVIPGVFVIFKLSLAIPAMLVERLSGKNGMKRSWELTKRSRRSLLIILAIQFLTPLCLAVIIAFLINSVLIAQGFPANEDLKDLVDNIYKLLWLPLDILLCTFASIGLALLYLKTRRSGGEDLDEWLTHFESYDNPQNILQTKLRRHLISNPKKSQE